MKKAQWCQSSWFQIPPARCLNSAEITGSKSDFSEDSVQLFSAILEHSWYKRAYLTVKVKIKAVVLLPLL